MSSPPMSGSKVVLSGFESFICRRHRKLCIRQTRLRIFERRLPSFEIELPACELFYELFVSN